MLRSDFLTLQNLVHEEKCLYEKQYSFHEITEAFKENIKSDRNRLYVANLMLNPGYVDNSDCDVLFKDIKDFLSTETDRNKRSCVAIDILRAMLEANPEVKPDSFGNTLTDKLFFTHNKLFHGNKANGFKISTTDLEACGAKNKAFAIENNASAIMFCAFLKELPSSVEITFTEISDALTDVICSLLKHTRSNHLSLTLDFKNSSAAQIKKLMETLGANSNIQKLSLSLALFSVSDQIKQFDEFCGNFKKLIFLNDLIFEYKSLHLLPLEAFKQIVEAVKLTKVKHIDFNESAFSRKEFIQLDDELDSYDCQKLELINKLIKDSNSSISVEGFVEKSGNYYFKSKMEFNDTKTLWAIMEADRILKPNNADSTAVSVAYIDNVINDLNILMYSLGFQKKSFVAQKPSSNGNERNVLNRETVTVDEISELVQKLKLFKPLQQQQPKEMNIVAVSRLEK